MFTRNFRLIFAIFIILLIPSFVLADDAIPDEDFSDSEILEVLEASGEVTDIPDINSRHAVIIDRLSRQVLFGKKETEKCKMASTTKIMSAIVTIENSNLLDLVVVSSKSAGTGGSRLGLSTNDKVTVESLLYGLMLRSGNDAAVALAEHVGGSVENFANMMNEKALELGLTSTHFVTPHGLDQEEHYTTALDLALLTDYALKNETFAKIVRTKNYTITINGQSKNISNTNELLGNFDGVYGVKTGFTNGANRCLVTACKRGDLDIICVVLGCDTKKNRTQDSIKLINYIYKNFTVVNIEDFIDSNFKDWYLLHSNSFHVNKGFSQFLKLSLDKSDLPYSYMAINISDLKKQETVISFTSFHEAPLFANTIVGSLSFKVNGREYFSLNIVNSNDIMKKNVFFYFNFLIKNYFKILDS